MAKQKGFFIKLDEDFSSDPKIRKLRRMAGRIAVLDYIELLPVFSRYDGYCIPFDDLADIAECDLFIKERDLRKSVDACIETGLFTTDGESFWSKRRCRDLGEKQRVAAERSKAGANGNAVRWGRKCDDDTIAKESQTYRNCDKDESQMRDNCNHKAIANESQTEKHAIASAITREGGLLSPCIPSLSPQENPPERDNPLRGVSPKNPPQQGLDRPSSQDEVRSYFRANMLRGDPQVFWDTYEAVGWIDASGRIVSDWRAKARLWASRENAKPMASTQKPRDYDGSYDGCRMEEVTI